MGSERVLEAFAVCDDVGIRFRGQTLIVLPAQVAREVGLKPGRWRMVKVDPSAEGHRILRAAAGDRCRIYREPPQLDGLEWSATGLVRAMCWDAFALATGLDLEQDTWTKCRLVQA